MPMMPTGSLRVIIDDPQVPITAREPVSDDEVVARTGQFEIKMSHG
jgi:hypothetical protein